MLKQIFVPLAKRALIITCSKYDCNFSPLPAAANDGKKMKEFLINHCNFDDSEIEFFADKLKEKIEREFDQLFLVARQAKTLNSRFFIFIYYSGHGTLSRGHTYGHTISGEEFNLDEMIRKLANCANTYVIAFLDCCREIVDHKGIGGSSNVSASSGETTKGQLKMIFSTRPQGQATSFRSQELSMATGLFLSAMNLDNGTELTEFLANWDAKTANGIEVLDKSTMGIYLKQPPIPPQAMTTSTTPTTLTTPTANVTAARERARERAREALSKEIDLKKPVDSDKLYELRHLFPVDPLLLKKKSFREDVLKGLGITVDDYDRVDNANLIKFLDVVFKQNLSN